MRYRLRGKFLTNITEKKSKTHTAVARRLEKYYTKID